MAAQHQRTGAGDDVPRTLDQAQCRLAGKHVTVAAFSYANFDALLAAKTLLSEFGIEIELLDMRSVRPLDVNSVIKSVHKTGHLVVTDTAQKPAVLLAN